MTLTMLKLPLTSDTYLQGQFELTVAAWQILILDPAYRYQHLTQLINQSTHASVQLVVNVKLKRTMTPHRKHQLTIAADVEMYLRLSLCILKADTDNSKSSMKKKSNVQNVCFA